MRVLILGASGLIGHKLLQKLSGSFETFAALHKSKEYYGNHLLFSGDNIIDKIEVENFDVLRGLLHAINPDVIINCVGITKRKIEIDKPIVSIEINSLFPHKLAIWAKNYGKRVIHFSTDCVFDGKLGNYNEDSITTAEDLYGKTKALGEINYSHSLTIRSSFIGQELFGKTELLEWFLSQNGRQINGYINTLYSGVSVIYMADIVKKIIDNYPKLSGLYQLALENPISKYDLLCIARDAYKINVDIIPDGNHIHKPTLDNTRLKKAIKITVPSWKEMMEKLAAEKEYYYNNKYLK